MRLSAPTPLADHHITDHFDCGQPALNDWLKNHARKSEARSARSFVVCDGDQVVGYYCLAAGGVLRDAVPSKLQRNMPGAIPVMILGRLAVDAAHQGKSLGSALLRDAMRRTIGVAKDIGLRAMLVHAIDDEAAGFYLRYGFLQFPEGSRTLFLPIETMAQAIGPPPSP